MTRRSVRCCQDWACLLQVADLTQRKYLEDSIRSQLPPGLEGRAFGAVAHAHSNLVVHRDLKPSNILVTGQGEVKLLDFGVAALLSGGGDHVTPLTHHVGPGLTPGYASPEQLLGQPITTATDAYSLGVVLFELLAGRRPTATSGQAKTNAEVIRLTLEMDAPRLSEFATWRSSPCRRGRGRLAIARRSSCRGIA